MRTSALLAQILTIIHQRRLHLLPPLQSAYCSGHSTETAVIKVLADILLALDRGDLAALTLLDLSAAFDTVDHATLIRRLQVSFFTAFVGVYWIGVRHTSVIVGCTFVRGQLDRDQLCCDLVYLRALYLGQSSSCFTRQASSTLSRSISYFLTFMLTTHGLQVCGFCRPDQTRLLVSVNRLQPVWRM